MQMFVAVCVLVAAGGVATAATGALSDDAV